MNFHSVLLTGIAIATFAWAMAFEAQAQTTPAPTEQSATPTPDAVAMPKKAKHHRSHALSTDSTPAEKAATDRLNTQQLQAAAPSSQQSGAAQPGTIDNTATGAIPENSTPPSPPPPTPPPPPQ